MKAKTKKVGRSSRSRSRLSDGRARGCARVITKDLAQSFARELTRDVSHSVESASLAVGLRPGTVRDAIHRFDHDKCASELDAEVCEILVLAKADHIKQIRKHGFAQARKGNRAGTAWMQWALEVQAPKEHPRKTQVELSGEDGRPIEANLSTVTYVVSVPEDEPDDE